MFVVPPVRCWLLLATVVCGLANSAAASPFDRPGSSVAQSRSVVVSANGMVVTSQPLAAQAGLEVLQKGGTAADAVIAANAVLGVIEPMNCGIGGDVFLLYWNAKTQRLYALSGMGRSPQGLTPEILKEKNISVLPKTGPLSWSVPGCVDGWEQLRTRFGSQEWPVLLERAIEYAENGVPVPEIVAQQWKAGEARVKKHPESARVLLAGGRAPRAGERVRNPALAATYRQLADGGRDAFYSGPIGEQIATSSQAAGGFLTFEDLKAHHSEWVEPISTDYRGHTVWSLPPPAQGVTVLQMLNLLESYNLKAMGHNSAELLHLFIEAKKLAYADRARFYSDPAFAEIPIGSLISKEYASTQRKRIDPNKAAKGVPAGDPLLQRGDTVCVVAVDSQGNCCSLMQGICDPFGSELVAGELGFLIQSRGAQFTLEPDRPTSYAPGKLPYHTNIPGFVTREGKPWLVFGVLGGDFQPQGQVQTLINMIDFEMNVQQAAEAARLRHVSLSPKAGATEPQPEAIVIFETGVSADIAKALMDKGQPCGKEAGRTFGGFQGIRIGPGGVYHGGTDPRRDGGVAAY